MLSNRVRAFTLVEILIVVVILGILAAIVTPQFASAADDAAETATYDQLQKVRKSLSYYYLRNDSLYPEVTEGEGSWGTLISPAYMRGAPVNAWIGSSNSKRVILRDSADTGFQSDYGWIFNPATGDVWAGGFNDEDIPYPRQ